MVPKVADPDPYGSVRYLFELLDLDTDSFVEFAFRFKEKVNENTFSTYW